MPNPLQRLDDPILDDLTEMHVRHRRRSSVPTGTKFTVFMFGTLLAAWLLVFVLDVSSTAAAGAAIGTSIVYVVSALIRSRVRTSRAWETALASHDNRGGIPAIPSHSWQVTGLDKDEPRLQLVHDATDSTVLSSPIPTLSTKNSLEHNVRLVVDEAQVMREFFVATDGLATHPPHPGDQSWDVQAEPGGYRVNGAYVADAAAGLDADGYYTDRHRMVVAFFPAWAEARLEVARAKAQQRAEQRKAEALERRQDVIDKVVAPREEQEEDLRRLLDPPRPVQRAGHVAWIEKLWHPSDQYKDHRPKYNRRGLIDRDKAFIDEGES